MIKVYQVNKDIKLKLVDTSEKTNLADGVILHWGGNIAWAEEDFVIIGRKTNQWGMSYKTASLENASIHWVDARTIKFQTEDVWHGQHFFVTPRKLEEADLITIKRLTEENEVKQHLEREREKNERLQKIQQGKEIAASKIPSEAKALIIAEQEVDISDTQTDYFNTKTVKKIVLGFSLHTRNCFAEMRKFASKLEKTKHLSEKNESYEHRENYSMGRGYYLKAGSYCSSGWNISKERKWDDNWSEEIYISLAENGVVTK